MCSDLPEIATRTELVIVRHQLEAQKTSNSGRIVALAMSHATIVDYPWLIPPQLAGPGSCLLFPEGTPCVAPPADATRLIVLDANWSQARKMRQRIPALRGMPVLSVPERLVPPVRRLRRSPKPGHLSTMESIARALALLDEPAAAAALDQLYDELVRRSDSFRS